MSGPPNEPETPDHYAILRLSQHVSDAEILQAFKNLKRKYHPDSKLPDSEPSEEKFKQVRPLPPPPPSSPPTLPFVTSAIVDVTPLGRSSIRCPRKQGPEIQLRPTLLSSLGHLPQCLSYMALLPTANRYAASKTTGKSTVRG
jgi:hypothetical protein